MYSKNQTISIKQLSTSLLNTLDPVETESIIHKIYEHFSTITNISGYGTEIKHLAAVPTASGMALSLNHAAQCLLDYKRTVRFLRGIVTAILDKQKEFPNQKITVFYVGCGPYAPFITLVAPLFSSEEVEFSILEINTDSLELAKKLILALGLQEYIKEYYLADAVTFTIPSPDAFHILFSETLDAVLYRESYVPIVYNMLPQLAENTIVIPENVLLTMRFRTYKENENAERSLLEEEHPRKIFDTREAIASLLPSTTTPSLFPAVRFNLKSNTKYHSVVIDTKVSIYKDLYLTRGESSLTLPCEISLENSSKFSSVVFTYRLQPQVELQYELQ